MVLAGYEKERSHAYSGNWREHLHESLSRLGLQKLSIDEVLKMEWSDLEDEIERWTIAANVSLRILFPSERRLCESVFSGYPSALDLSFMEVCRGSSIPLLNFVDAVAISSRSPHPPPIWISSLPNLFLLRKLNALKNYMLVFDVYTPKETRLCLLSSFDCGLIEQGFGVGLIWRLSAFLMSIWLLTLLFDLYDSCKLKSKFMQFTKTLKNHNKRDKNMDAQIDHRVDQIGNRVEQILLNKLTIELNKLTIELYKFDHLLGRYQGRLRTW